MTGRPLLLALVLAAPASAQGQSFEEAVRANVQLATNICLQVMIGRTPPMSAFGGAGFAYRPVDRGVNAYGVALGTDHYFDAPADTAKAEVDAPEGPAGLCMVLTTHLAEAEVAAITAGESMRVYPSAQIRGPTELFIPTPSGLPLIVTTDTIGTNHRYEPSGTVRVTMGYPG